MIAASDEERVRICAGNRCEYCRMHQALQGASFHIEHVLPRSAGGDDSLENLALACPSCNLHKSNRTEAIDSQKNQIVPVFSPRTMNWNDHFYFKGNEIVGKSTIGRATVAVLNFNHPRRIKIRRAEALFDLFPPSD